ncbi:tripartite tricarboxylate transporter TctB family protein [Salinarimonas soli]|uniref:Tripartite tricarboxylate transporter TctB family protein n=1 Tax=Salinarimonas soli TaxID=1638099 RepID=A0A5B2VF14_9HYPH|nr:tripartite tricarboxylate transporter TctB family protein [Salinarimonas soli]KAA2236972.1 tripartite tricarboxylate transporter TctB family protein [Salinarimonas soli]
MASDDNTISVETPRGPVRGPQTLAAGLVMLALAGIALWALGGLSSGTARSMGPGMMPRGLAYMVAACGVLLLVFGIIRQSDPIERFSIRSPFFVLTGILAFALTIRVFGLAVAGPLCLIIGGLATPDARIKELVIFAAIMTGVCIALFRYALNLPMPILIIPNVIYI